MERSVLAAIVTAAGGEVDTAVAEQVERGPLLGDADRMMERQHAHRGSETDALGAGGDVREHQVGTGQNAEGAEMMLADPGGSEADLLGVNRFVDDRGNEFVGSAQVVQIMIVAEREISELHARASTPLSLESWRRSHRGSRACRRH